MDSTSSLSQSSLSREATIGAHLHLVDAVVGCLLKRRRIVGLERDDLVQEGRIALIQAVDSFDDSRGASLSTWILCGIKNALLNVARDAGRDVTLHGLQESFDQVQLENCAIAPSPADQVEAKLLTEQVLPYVPTRQRQALELHFLHDLSKTEIAQRMNISLQRAGQLISDGLANLKRLAEAPSLANA